MQDYLSDLLWYCTEHMVPPIHDPKFQADSDKLSVLEEKIKKALGIKFMTEYNTVCFEALRWQDMEIFRQGLRLGAWFAMEAFGQSPTTSAP